MGDRPPILTGSVSETTPTRLLQILSLCRQYMAIHFYDGSQTLLGKVWVKSGVVVAAEARGVHGVPAFYQLVSTHLAATFELYVEPGFEEVTGTPLGTLVNMLTTPPPEALVTPQTRRS